MKKTFLNLRKMGFVLVAATSMLAFSCGGGEEGETTEGEGETTEETTDETTDETTEESCEEACEGADADTTAGEGACEEGACEEGACEGAE